MIPTIFSLLFHMYTICIPVFLPKLLPQIAPVSVRIKESHIQEPRNVPVITSSPTTRIFGPCLINAFSWSPMASPAYAPTMVNGGEKMN